MKGNICCCEEIKDIGGIFNELGGSVWKGICGHHGSSGKGNDPISNACDSPFRDSCSILDLNFPQYLVCLLLLEIVKRPPKMTSRLSIFVQSDSGNSGHVSELSKEHLNPLMLLVYRWMRSLVFHKEGDRALADPDCSLTARASQGVFASSMSRVFDLSDKEDWQAHLSVTVSLLMSIGLQSVIN
jgi:hypothetical protein